jgi:hypothetical protein
MKYILKYLLVIILILLLVVNFIFRYFCAGIILIWECNTKNINLCFKDQYWIWIGIIPIPFKSFIGILKLDLDLE